MTRTRVSTMLVVICLLAAISLSAGDTSIVAQDKPNADLQPKKRDDADGQPIRVINGDLVRLYFVVRLKDREKQSLERRELTLALKKMQEQRSALQQGKLKVLQAGIRDIKRQISELEALEKPRASGVFVARIVGDNNERAIAVALAKARVHAKRLQRAAPVNAPGFGFIFDNLAGRRDE